MRGILTDFNIVKDTFNECGLELISNKSDYINCHTKLDYVCKKHRYLKIQKYSLTDVRAKLKNNTYGCPECSKERIKHKVISGIYLITNIINNKKYIGQSWDIYRRWTGHKTSLRGNYHGNSHLQRAWNKYGEHNFTFEILNECSTQKELDDKEIYYISKYNSANSDFGYNEELGGNGTGKRPESLKKRISVSKRGMLSKLSQDDVRRIKMAVFLGIDRKEIFKQFNTNRAVITAICTGQTYSYILPELTKYTKNIGEYYRNKRKKEILEAYDDLGSIKLVVNKLGYSQSIVEKTIYTNRSDKYRNRYFDIYNKVFEMYNSGMVKYEISKELHISPSTVERYLSGQNNPNTQPPNKKIDKTKEIEIIDFYRNGESIADISKKYNVSRTTIKCVIDKYKNIDNYYEELMAS